MKKIVSILSIVFVVGVLSSNAQCCKDPNPDCTSEATCTGKTHSHSDVKAYYFHSTHRCATCQAVETVTKDALKEYYGDKVDFQSLNIEDEKENAMIEKYKVSGQTLLFIKGNQVVNLTNDAFMNARTNPDKLKTKIKLTVDSMI